MTVRYISTLFVLAAGACATEESIDLAEPIDLTAQCPASERIAFDVEGTVVPDATTLLHVDGTAAHLDGWHVTQSPAAGSQFDGVGAFTVSLVGERDGETAECDFEMLVEDNTPPTISVIGIEDGARYFEADFAGLEVEILDDVDEEVESSITLDGAAWRSGDEVGLGSHELIVRATDSSGNLEARTVVFEVSAYRRLEIVGSIASLGCTELEPGVASFGADVLLGSATFDAKEIDLYTLMLWPLDDDNTPIDSPARIAGSIDLEGGYSFETAQAHYEGGIWQLSFSGAARACPTRFLLTGGAHRGEDGDGDFILPLDDGSLDDPFAGLVFAVNNDGAMTPPPAAAFPPCRWRGEPLDENFDPPIARIEKAKTYQKVISMDANHGFISGRGWVRDSWMNKFTEAVEAQTMNAHGSYHVWLEGAETCDCTPRVTCTFEPELSVHVEMNSPAAAHAIGVVDVRSSQCDLHKTAEGGLTVGSNEPETMTVNFSLARDDEGTTTGEVGAEITAKLSRGDADDDTFTVGAAEPKTVDASDVTATFRSKGKIRLSANTVWNDWYAEGEARLTGFRRGIKLEGVCGQERQIFRY